MNKEGEYRLWAALMKLWAIPAGWGPWWSRFAPHYLIVQPRNVTAPPCTHLYHPATLNMAPTTLSMGFAPHPRWRTRRSLLQVRQRHFRQAREHFRQSREHFRQLRALFRPWRPAWRSGSWSGWTSPGLPGASAASRPPPSSESTTRRSWAPSRASRRLARCGHRGRSAGEPPGAADGADPGAAAGDRGGGADGDAMGAEPRGRGGAAGRQPRGSAVPEPPRGGAAPGRGHGGYRGYRRGKTGGGRRVAHSVVSPQKLPGGSLGFSKAMANKWVRLDKGAPGGPRVLRAVSGPGGDGRGSPVTGNVLGWMGGGLQEFGLSLRGMGRIPVGLCPAPGVPRAPPGALGAGHGAGTPGPGEDGRGPGRARAGPQRAQEEEAAPGNVSGAKLLKN